MGELSLGNAYFITRNIKVFLDSFKSAYKVQSFGVEAIALGVLSIENGLTVKHFRYKLLKGDIVLVDMIHVRIVPLIKLVRFVLVAPEKINANHSVPRVPYEPKFKIFRQIYRLHLFVLG